MTASGGDEPSAPVPFCTPRWADKRRKRNERTMDS
uniref:Uncharacterized protein n=1 Tax=Nelumbo nucifera TaxID=4432 RepID=A0A822XTC6_NELNU|nr:TPA_asm: hypothetical protein HUJ06_022161 [Nelumbo nucifera]